MLTVANNLSGIIGFVLSVKNVKTHWEVVGGGAKFLLARSPELEEVVDLGAKTTRLESTLPTLPLRFNALVDVTGGWDEIRTFFVVNPNAADDFFGANELGGLKFGTVELAGL